MNVPIWRTILAVGLLTSTATAQSDVSLAPRSKILDNAKIFSPEAVQQAKKALELIERSSNVAVTIETVDSIHGDSIDEAALKAAKATDSQGVFLLIAKKEHHISLPRVRQDLERRLPASARTAIRQAIMAEFKSGDFDAGLKRGIDELTARLYSTADLPSPASPLIERDRVRLTLAGARRVLAAAEAKAGEKGWKMNIAVVDDGGHLLAFARMDGARPASAATARTKAISAATFRQATGPLMTAGSPDLLLNLSLQHAAEAGGATITTLLGGVPIVIDGQVIGAIGVGGGTGEQDAEAAKAGVSAIEGDVKGVPSTRSN